MFRAARHDRAERALLTGVRIARVRAGVRQEGAPGWRLKPEGSWKTNRNDSGEDDQ